MPGRRPDNRGISHDNETAREASAEGRVGLREAREIEALYKREPRLQYVITFRQFKASFTHIYETRDTTIRVRGLNDKWHSFPQSERHHAQDYALRLLVAKFLKSDRLQRTPVGKGGPAKPRDEPLGAGRVWRR